MYHSHQLHLSCQSTLPAILIIRDTSVHPSCPNGHSSGWESPSRRLFMRACELQLTLLCSKHPQFLIMAQEKLEENGFFYPRLKKKMMMMMKNINKTHVAASSGAAEGIKWRIWNTFILITKSICHCGFSLIFNIPRIIAFRGFYNNRYVAWNIFWFHKTPGSQTPVTTHSPDTKQTSAQPLSENLTHRTWTWLVITWYVPYKEAYGLIPLLRFSEATFCRITTSISYADDAQLYLAPSADDFSPRDPRESLFGKEKWWWAKTFYD